MGIIKCCIPNCATTSDSGISLHCFPRTPYRQTIWLRLINCPVLNKLFSRQLIYKRVCAKHFENKFFENKRLNALIARPTLFTSEEIKSGIPKSVQSKYLSTY